MRLLCSLEAMLQAGDETIEIAHPLSEVGPNWPASTPVSLYHVHRRKWRCSIPVLYDRVVSSDRQGCARNLSVVSSKRLPAVLSLCSIAAAHKAPSGMPPSLRWAFVTGAYSRMSFAPYDTNGSSFSCPPSTRFRTAAAARNLNVLHIGKRSSDR